VLRRKPNISRAVVQDGAAQMWKCRARRADAAGQAVKEAATTITGANDNYENEAGDEDQRWGNIVVADGSL